MNHHAQKYNGDFEFQVVGTQHSLLISWNIYQGELFIRYHHEGYRKRLNKNRLEQT